MQDVPYFMEVVTRMPRLTELDLRMNIPTRLIAKPLTAFLSSLPGSLETIIFPNYHITSLILSTLSHLPHLHTVQFEYFSAPSSCTQGAGCIANIQSLSPTLGTDIFPALSDLSLMAPYKTYSAPRAPLHAGRKPDEPVHRLRGAHDARRPGRTRVLGVRGRGMWLLGTFYLDLLWMDRPWVWPVRELDDRVTLDTLEPLFSCPHPV
jgi:hypothetical protein